MFTAIILTLNEAQHLPRCLASIEGVVDSVVVVDCYSSDETVAIAKEYGAKVLQKDWVNYATQFNWALQQIAEDTEWVLRIDADEYLTPILAAEIHDQLLGIGTEIDGVYCGRRMTFQGSLIRFGGVFPIRILRLFRSGRGKCENRWMDEHIKVSGPTVDFKGEIIDDNLKSLTWWTEKHNNYSSREAVDLLNLKHNFMPLDSVASLGANSEAGLKRWIKENIYARFPRGVRAFAYFLYRYLFRLGFLDGRVGTTFHFLQGFWYRYLVDAKVHEVEQYVKKTGCSVPDAISYILSINVLPEGRTES